MKILLSMIPLVCILLLASCTKKDHADFPRTDAATAYRYVEEQVAFGPRPSGSPALVQCAEWIRKKLNHPAVAFLEEIEFEDVTPSGKMKFRNLTAMIPGKSKQFVVVGAHYDTKMMSSFPFVGANDGASGVAGLLAMIDAIETSGKTPPFSILFVFFDGEECRDSYTANDGLHGSRRMAQELRKRNQLGDCKGMILLDMIGDKDLSVTIPTNSDPALIAKTQSVADLLGLSGEFALSSGAILDDHVPFAEMGIPSIDLIDFEYGPENAYWHSPSDTLDKVSGESIRKVSDTALGIIWNL